jgi:hypothetical protein
MNLNDLAVEVAKREGGKEALSIAQIKEVLRILGDILREAGICGSILLMLRLRK